MSPSPKTFDCLEMKNRIQAERLAEYEQRKGEFGSYIEFINNRVKDSALAAFLLKRRAPTARRNRGQG
jgi:hypothetical protein